MKPKISVGFYLIGILPILVMTALLCLNFYNLFRQEKQQELKTYSQMLEMNTEFITEPTKYQSQVNVPVRITLILKDGTVVYDNQTAAEAMENHLDREEVQEALKHKEGNSRRNSDTLGEETVYYARQLDNGMIIRIADNMSNIWGIYGKALPVVAFMMLCMILISMAVAQLLTNQLIRPIEKMAENMDEIEKNVAYEELRPFAQKIQSQSSMRKEFTANVSHELKTPLTSISGYAQLIESGMAKTEDIQDFAHKINKEANRLLSLINDIIKLSRLEEGNTAVSLEEVDLLEIAQSCKGRLDLKAKERKVTVSIVGDSICIKAYKSMVDEMLFNLCDNAIRYNCPHGLVIVSVYETEEYAVVAVKDNGIGIPEEHLKHVFERFYRVDKSHSKETGGTGLGLSIVKHGALYHKAKLEIESLEGKGTEIRILFPIR